MAYRQEVVITSVPLSPEYGLKLKELTRVMGVKSKTQMSKKLLESAIDERLGKEHRRKTE